MPTLHERHRVPDLSKERRALKREEQSVLSRLISLGVLEDKALRAVKERGLTDAHVDANLAAGLPPHFIEYQDPKLLEADAKRVAHYRNVDTPGRLRDPNAGYGKVGV